LSNLSSAKVSLITAIPFLAALPSMLVVGWHSDRTGERRWHTALPMFVAGLALAAGQGLGGDVTLALASFSIAAMGLASYRPGFWSMPTTFLSEGAAAASIGFINSFGNLGGFLGPYAVGYLSNKTGDYRAAVLYLVGSAILSGLLVFQIRGVKL